MPLPARAAEGVHRMRSGNGGTRRCDRIVKMIEASRASDPPQRISPREPPLHRRCILLRGRMFPK